MGKNASKSEKNASVVAAARAAGKGSGEHKPIFKEGNVTPTPGKPETAKNGPGKPAKGKDGKKPTEGKKTPDKGNGKPKKGTPAAVVSSNSEHAISNNGGKAPKGAGKAKEAKPHGVPVRTVISGAYSDGRFASVTIMGYSLSKVVRSLGRAGMLASDVRKIMDALGLEAVRINSIRTWVQDGKAADKDAAPLAKGEVEKLKALAK